MTKKELLELNAVLIKLANYGKTKFKYAVLKNIELLKSNVGVLTELENEIKKHIDKFEEARNQLILKIGKKKEDGSVFIDVSNKEMIELFNEGLSVLLKEHNEELETYNTKMGEFQDVLNEELEEEFIFKTLSIEQLPEEDVTMTQLEILEKSGIITD